MLRKTREVGLTQNDVDIQSAGPTGVWEFVATGKSVGMAGVPDWIPPVQAAGVKVKVIPSDEYFPHMAQGIAASDQIIKEKPEMVRKFVHAALRGMKDIMDDPEKESDNFVRFVPDWKGKEVAVKFAFNMYAKLVYPGQKELGEVNGAKEEVETLFPILKSRSSQMAGNLSGGEQQMLALGGALMTKPKLLMIDELSLGLAPTIVGRLVDIVRAKARPIITASGIWIPSPPGTRLLPRPDAKFSTSAPSRGRQLA